MGVVAGKVMPLPRGEYDPAEVYMIIDMVTLNNKLWIAKQSNFSNQEPFKGSEYWMLAVDGTTDVKALEQLVTEKIEEYDGKFSTIEQQLSTTIESVNSTLTDFSQTVNETIAASEQAVDAKLNDMEQNVETKLATYAKGEGLEFGVTDSGILTVTYDDGT